MVNNYDKIAKHYDFLSRLVFFKSQVYAQINQLKHIPKNSSILIVGGGTGWILEEITKIHSSGLEIVYVEVSAKMITLSKQKNSGNNTVEFFSKGIENFATQNTFDIILTPFLFDNFSVDDANSAFKKLDKVLKNNGLWFFTDFNVQGKSAWWKLLFIQFMYQFFTIFKIIDTKKLINMSPYFEKYHYAIVEKKLYYGTFIEAIVYRKKLN
ncbi:MAG: methyltransferase domain-containing protein [Flavobacterium sp.]